MSASRMFALTGASVFRNRLRRHCTSAFIPSPEPPITLINPVPSSSVFFPRYSSLAAGLEASSTYTDATGDDVRTSLLNAQLWPEWVAFVDNLKSKGYFAEKSTSFETADGNGNDGGILDDMNSLKTAFLSFARDRFDIFKEEDFFSFCFFIQESPVPVCSYLTNWNVISLSKNEVQTVEDKGCPNLLGKAMNAAKRLRAHLQLNEGDVCNACVLHESCDRAFSELKDSEATAPTVDIVSIMISYVLDQKTVTSGSDKTPDREAVELSARNLLTELTELRETERDDDLVDPDVVVFKQTKQSVSENAGNNQMRSGDWICPKCNFLNFGRNKRCKECREDGPTRVAGNARRPGGFGNDIEMKQGDWICPECKFMNFAKNVVCLQCRAKGPNNLSMGPRKPGDWNCNKCGFVNFASITKCKRCSDPRSVIIKGEWECPGCHYWNYSRNTSCKKCDHERPI